MADKAVSIRLGLQLKVKNLKRVNSNPTQKPTFRHISVVPTFLYGVFFPPQDFRLTL